MKYEEWPLNTHDICHRHHMQRLGRFFWPCGEQMTNIMYLLTLKVDNLTLSSIFEINSADSSVDKKIKCRAIFVLSRLLSSLYSTFLYFTPLYSTLLYFSLFLLYFTPFTLLYFTLLYFTLLYFTLLLLSFLLYFPPFTLFTAAFPVLKLGQHQTQKLMSKEKSVSSLSPMPHCKHYFHQHCYYSP